MSAPNINIRNGLVQIYDLLCSITNKTKRNKSLTRRKVKQLKFSFREIMYVVLGLMNSWSLLELENMIIETLASHKTVSSWAFLNRPFLLLEYVTCRLVWFSILLIWIFPLAIFFFSFCLSLVEEIWRRGQRDIITRRRKKWKRKSWRSKGPTWVAKNRRYCRIHER